MAEFVQQNIEEMLPELEQMERVELMNPSETKKILKKRKAFEYRLRRKIKQKEDFVQYAQYEMNVLQLISRRRKKIGHKHKFKEIEVPIVERIHKIFKMACWRFKEDVKLWLSHIDFCKRKHQHITISKLYTALLQVHNRNPGLWVSAAKHEVESNSSMENARPLLQRGLRFNPQSQLLWREYFRMELLFAEKMRMRREMLGLESLAQAEEKVPDVVLEGAVAYVVYQQASAALPDDVEFLLSFLPICQLFPFAEKLFYDILNGVTERHPSNELLYEAKARTHLYRAQDVRRQEGLDKKQIAEQCVELEEKCYDVFEMAVKDIRTEHMYSLYVKTLLEHLEKKTKKHHHRLLQQSNLAILDQYHPKRLTRTLSVLERAARAGCLSEDDCLKWIAVLENSGQIDTVREAVVSITELHPSCARVWLARLKHAVVIGTSYKEVMNVFKQACSTVKPDETLLLWQLMYDWMSLTNQENVPAFLQSGVQSGSSDVVLAAKVWSLQWAALHDDLDALTTVYKKMSTMQPLSVEFFQTYIDLLKTQPKPKMKRLRNAYEDAIRQYGSSNIDLWMSYISLERDRDIGDPTRASQLHWRAMKALDSSLVEAFVTQYTLSHTGVSS